jgi:pimeloyl-ACP methyl ester carboxylesterase
VIARDIEESGTAESVLLGHAFGNRAVRATATKYPEGVLGVVLVAAGGLRPIEEKAAEALRNCFDPRRTAAQRLEDIRYGFFAAGNEIPDYWRRGWHRHTATLQGQATSAIDSAEWWGAGGVRMLIVQADGDKIAPRKDTSDLLAQEFEERIEVAVIENTGHALLPESPEEVARVIMKFLDELNRRNE